MSTFNDVKRPLSLDFETGNRTQSKIKRLKGSKSAYLDHISKIISRISFLMSEPDNVEMVICFRYTSRAVRSTRRSFRLQ